MPTTSRPLVLALTVGAALLATVPARPGQEQVRSPRTVEVLRFDCASIFGRREVTLFGNGTVRLRDGMQGEELLYLLELGPGELRSMLARLEDEDLAETEEWYHTVEGSWVEQCTLDLELPGSLTEHFSFSRYDTLTLQLQRVVAIAVELAERAGERPPEGAEQIPAGYEPEVGDRLQRADGAVFEIMAVTTTVSGRGVELLGLDQPLTVYVLADQLPEVFVGLEPRRDH